MVLSKASQKTFDIKAKNWSESVHRFLKQCADAGNVEACYTLGMVSKFSQRNFYDKQKSINIPRNEFNDYCQLIIFFCSLDSLLLFTKPRQRSLDDGQGGD